MSSKASAELIEPSVHSSAPPSPQVGLRPETPAASSAGRARYLRLGLLGAVIAWTLGWYWDSAASMALVWWRSDTFAHGMVVYPIALWLIWGKRFELAAIECGPSLVGLALAALASFAWLLGEVGNVQAARHFGVVALIAASVWAVLGTKLVKAIAFPLAFTLLAVPVGEFLVPAMIEHTADFTVGALRLTGIPVYREGNDFVVPSGHWSVAEACSGLRYLIASIVLGVLYAYISYRSLLRRSLFVLASIAVPVLANWVRAYMIVMIGHLSGMKYAVGVDHLIYGWVFFGAVMLLLFWLGARWREDVAATLDRPQLATAPQPIRSGLVAGALATAVAVAIAPTYAEYLDRRQGTGGPLAIAVPEAANGWQPSSPASWPLQPQYVGAKGTLEQFYEKDGKVVGIFIAYYADQWAGRELVSTMNRIVPRRDPFWRIIEEQRVGVDNDLSEVVRTKLRSPDVDLSVWHWYWSGGKWVVRPAQIKLNQALAKLRGEGDDGAVVIVFARERSDDRDPYAVLKEFTTDMAPSIRTALERAKRSRTAALAPGRGSPTPAQGG